MTHDEMLALPKTRHESMSVGSNKYFTGEACSNGHISGRYTNTSRCVKCSSIYEISKYREKVKTGAKYKPENIEKVKARNAKYRLENPEKLKARNAKYYLDNLEKVKAQQAKYRLEDPEKVLQAAMKKRQLIKPDYIAGLLKVSTKQLTPEIIELKRLQIQLHRAIKESQS